MWSLSYQIGVLLPRPLDTPIRTSPSEHMLLWLSGNPSIDSFNEKGSKQCFGQTNIKMADNHPPKTIVKYMKLETKPIHKTFLQILSRPIWHPPWWLHGKWFFFKSFQMKSQQQFLVYGWLSLSLIDFNLQWESARAEQPGRQWVNILFDQGRRVHFEDGAVSYWLLTGLFPSSLFLLTFAS